MSTYLIGYSSSYFGKRYPIVPQREAHQQDQLLPS
jgi:hypothetical protein